MTSVGEPVAADKWLVPILMDILPKSSLDALECAIGVSYWRAAVDKGLLSNEEVLEALSRRTRFRIAADLLVSTQARDKVPEWLARRFGILPLAISESTLDIATSNPYDLDCEKTLAFAAARTVRMCLASPDRIQERIEEVYAPVGRVSRLLDAVGKSSTQHVIEKADDTETQLDEKQAERPVIKLVDHIVAEGIAAGASDIHLEAGESGIAVRYRIDGMLKEVMVLPKAVGVPLVSRIKIMSQMDIADRLRPQGGRARVAINGARVDLRVSTLPASHGEKVVIRILDSRAALRSVESLGLDPVDGPRMQKLLEVREGLILVTGPTGSGKTTTLYAALRLLQHRGVNIITVEDPVEYRIPGIVQVQIHEKAGLTFASALRSVLRQDPDVVLIGEIRDRETAAIAIQASLTGHLVFATLHTNDACSSITRLTDLGVDPVKLAGALKGVVAQRLDSAAVPRVQARRQRRCATAPGRIHSRKLDGLRPGGMHRMRDDGLLGADRGDGGPGDDTGDRARHSRQRASGPTSCRCPCFRYQIALGMRRRAGCSRGIPAPRSWCACWSPRARAPVRVQARHEL